MSESLHAYWNQKLAPYKKSDYKIALFQVANTAIPFVLTWYLMLWSLEFSYGLTLVLAVPAAFFSTRLFIFQHDCGHGSFFPSRRANHFLGSILGVVTLTPYHCWRKAHSVHHATSGNLDRRELGDVTTWTVREYLESSWLKRLGYRIYRHPLLLLFIAPFYLFVLKHRFPFDVPFAWRKEWASVMWTNLAIVGVVLGMSWAVGLERFLLVQGPITLIAGTIGVWLFFVQHQFEDTYWRKREDWDFHLAGLEGSSYCDLPPLLHWLTGNIGYHHIHHISSRIPNYHLPRCFKEIPELQDAPRVRLSEGLRYFGLKLWDEEEKRLVGFSHLREARLRRETALVA